MLQSLGLSSSENNVYLSLIQQTMQGAKEIAHNLQIPLSKAYQTLTNLENLGIIIKNKTRPASFSANEPKQVIDTLLKLRTEELEQVVKQASTIEQQLYQLIDIRRLDSNTLQINVGKKLREKNALVMLST